MFLFTLFCIGLMPVMAFAQDEGTMQAVYLDGERGDDTKTVNGEGIHNRGKLEITGGEISNNWAAYGGGIHNDGGTISFSGGKVKDNEAAIYGAGISVVSGILLMEGSASVTGNDTPYNGAGVYILNSGSDGSTFQMTGGTISGNSIGEGYAGSGIFGECLSYYSGQVEIQISGGTIENMERDSRLIALHSDKEWYPTLGLSGSPDVRGGIFLWDRDYPQGFQINVTGEFNPTNPIEIERQNTVYGIIAVAYVDGFIPDLNDFSPYQSTDALIAKGQNLIWIEKESIPSATFTATGDNSGILSDVDSSMKYSTDGGDTWKDITGDSMEITGVTAEDDVKLYVPGDGSSTLDSDIQTIDITQAAAPSELGSVTCTTDAQNDGQITGVSAAMEYKASGSAQWIPVTGNTITGLASGNYDVRVKAAGTMLASPVVIVVVEAYVQEPTTGQGTAVSPTSEEIQQNSIQMDRKTSVKATGKSLKVKWKKVDGADGYDIYAAVCSKKFKGVVKSVSGDVKSVTIKKIAGKKLKAKQSYKVKVRAYRMVDGEKVYIANGRTLHVVFGSNTKYTNAKKIRVNKKNYTLKEGKTAKIRASIVKQDETKKLLSKGHGAKLTYISSNRDVAKVSKNGKITAKGKGKCTIYVYALNGTCKKVKVTVR